MLYVSSKRDSRSESFYVYFFPEQVRQTSIAGVWLHVHCVCFVTLTFTSLFIWLLGIPCMRIRVFVLELSIIGVAVESKEA